MVRFAKWVAVLVVLGPGLALSGQNKVEAAGMGGRPAIISPNHPKDSEGDVVYEPQGKTQMDVPVVPGVLTNPKPTSTPYPKFSEAMRRAKFVGEVTVEGVITPQGKVIDLEAQGTPDAEAAASALEAVNRYRFQPATLDGKPVALIVRVVVTFRVR